MISEKLTSAKIVIIGSGPSGIGTAAALAECGCQDITIFDERPDPTMFETTRAYSQVLYQTGQRFIQKIPGLDEEIKKASFCQHMRVVSDITADGKQHVVSTKPPAGPVYWLLKSTMLRIFHSHVKINYPQVKIRNNVKVREVEMKDGEPTSLVIENSDLSGFNSEEKVNFEVLIACDGSESNLRVLMAKNDPLLQSSNGMKIFSRDSPSTNLRHKGIVMNESPVLSQEGEEVMVATPSVIYNLRGDRNNRSKESVFDMILLPVCAGKEEKRRAALCIEGNHRILSITDVDEMYDLFKENFPQLQVEKIFSRDEMTVFTETPASTFPAIKRPMSLVGHFKNSTNPSSIVFIGDSAHSFPPDAAQGTNSTLQDIEALMITLQDSSDTDSWKQILEKYEKKRNGETWALLQLMSIAAPYQYKQDIVGYSGYMLNKNIRKKLSGVLPGMVHEDVDTLIRQGMSYKQVRLFNNITKFTFSLLTASIVALPLILKKANKEEIED